VRDEAAGQPVPFVRRVRATDYRSIADCDVTLGPLTVLLGLNASGKSNFVDVLHFVADALETSPIQAAAKRGGLDALLRRGLDRTARSFTIQLDLGIRLPDTDADLVASYGFAIGPDPAGEAPLRVLGEVARTG
jgi:predicted ATPase